MMPHMLVSIPAIGNDTKLTSTISQQGTLVINDALRSKCNMIMNKDIETSAENDEDEEEEEIDDDEEAL